LPATLDALIAEETFSRQRTRATLARTTNLDNDSCHRGLVHPFGIEALEQIAIATVVVRGLVATTERL
jgi:hypothetical protein